MVSVQRRWRDKKEGGGELLHFSLALSRSCVLPGHLISSQHSKDAAKCLSGRFSEGGGRKKKKKEDYTPDIECGVATD